MYTCTLLLKGKIVLAIIFIIFDEVQRIKLKFNNPLLSFSMLVKQYPRYMMTKHRGCTSLTAIDYCCHQQILSQLFLSFLIPCNHRTHLIYIGQCFITDLMNDSNYCVVHIQACCLCNSVFNLSPPATTYAKVWFHAFISSAHFKDLLCDF